MPVSNCPAYIVSTNEHANGVFLQRVGGAIAFGHPLGCTGARQVSTLLYELKRTGKKVGVSSMCVGTGKSYLNHRNSAGDI